MSMIHWAAGLALIAAASAPGAAAKVKTADSADPNREICKSRPVVGSRLKRIRTCMTAQQWDDLKLQEQVGLSRKQINGDPGCPEGGCLLRGGKDTPW
jgi:hypothetical protein